MQIERLGYFLEVARAGSIKRASEKINISQQALSQSMAAMEQELGMALLERGKKGVTLTAAGEKVQEAAREICFIYENLIRSLQKEESAEKQIAIGIAPYMESEYYVKALNYVKWKYPHSKIQMVSAYDYEAAQLLEQRSIDLAMVSIKGNVDDFLVKYPNLMFIEFKKLQLFALINKKHKVEKNKKISFSQIEKYKLIINELNDYDEEFLSQVLDIRGKAKVVMMKSSHVMQEMVAEDLAIGLAGKQDEVFDEYKSRISCIELDLDKNWGSKGVLFCKDRAEDEMIQDIARALQDDRMLSKS